MRIGVISSCLPKKCGIATFSRDLINGMQHNRRSVKAFFIAAETAFESYRYDNNVVATVKTNKRQTYTEAARILNDLKLDVILLEHEYGLYGGKQVQFRRGSILHTEPVGDYILDLIRLLDAPLITILHTILAKPYQARLTVVKELEKVSRALVTMTNVAKLELIKTYNTPATKVHVIPHGVPVVPSEQRERIIKRIGLDPTEIHLVITGLINPNKGIDLTIEALPKIIDKNPRAKLLVVGQTHPHILQAEGERYRQWLKGKAQDLGVTNHVQFINSYLPTQLLMDYIKMADVYLTPHRDPQQAASGTLAYALGAGRVIVSTPYAHAKELLAVGRGYLVPFNSADGIAKAVNTLLADKALYKRTSQRADQFADKMGWPVVGKSFLDLIDQVLRINEKVLL